MLYNRKLRSKKVWKVDSLLVMGLRSTFPHPQSQSGFLFVNKPEGMTSHDVVDRLRQITRIKKIGHAGTLDPLATGLLICGVGRDATKKLSIFLRKDKEYEAVIRLGAVSDTDDKEGKITLLGNVKPQTEEDIKKTLVSFLGKMLQTPPIFSARKQKGRKLYELARKGEHVSPKPIEVEIYSISLLDYRWPHLLIRVRCSSGTYIRSLARDIGKRLGCGAYLERLCRTRIGDFSLEGAVDLSNLNAVNWQKFLHTPLG